MSTPNTGPDHLDQSDIEGSEDARRRNPASVYHDELTGVIEAATTRATTVSHRFRSVRHALTRRRPPESPDAA